MRQWVVLAAAGLTAGCMAGEPAELSQREQSELQEELAGRTAGPPVNCVDQQRLRGNRSVGDAAILFEGRDGTLYVNQPAGGCPSLSLGRSLRTRTISTRLCQGDIVTVFDPVSGAEYGGCGLGQFVPYSQSS